MIITLYVTFAHKDDPAGVQETKFIEFHERPSDEDIFGLIETMDRKENRIVLDVMLSYDSNAASGCEYLVLNGVKRSPL